MKTSRGIIFASLACLGFLCISARQSFAYAALTHEAIVDAAWDDSIKPLLIRRYAGVTEAELQKAHAYAYGGCILQDMGYYPFGSGFFSDLLHYVRSGDFAMELLTEAQPINEYAFALGALEHYVADQTGHPLATNVAVSIEYPKLREKYDSWVTYEDDPAAHMKIEFGFDVLQVARGRYTPERHHEFIGFEVARDLFDRAFYKVYGVQVSDLLIDEDLAIGTYRRTVSQLIPEATKIAWEMKKDELQSLVPGIQRDQFVFTLSRKSYEQEWGNQYERPHWYDSALALIFRAVPRFGPLQGLSVKPLSPASERLYAASFAKSVERYRDILQQLPAHPALANANLDTGEPARAGTYELADAAYAQLVLRLREQYFAEARPEPRRSILAFYGDLNAPIATKRHEKGWRDLMSALAELRAAPAEQSSAATASAQ